MECSAKAVRRLRRRPCIRLPAYWQSRSIIPSVRRQLGSIRLSRLISNPSSTRWRKLIFTASSSRNEAAMWRVITVPLVMIGMTVASVRADEPAAPPSAAAEKYEALVKRFQESGRSPELINEFMALAREQSGDPASIDALSWVVVNVREGEQPNAAVQMLLDEHAADDRTKDVCPTLIKTPSIAGETLLRGLLDKSPHESV